MYLKVVRFKVFNREAIEYILDFRNLNRTEVTERVKGNIYSTAKIESVNTYELTEVKEPDEPKFSFVSEAREATKEETVGTYTQDSLEEDGDKKEETVMEKAIRYSKESQGEERSAPSN